MKKNKKSTIRVGAIGGCVKDMFVVAPAHVLKTKINGSTQEMLSYEYGAKIPVERVVYDFGGCAANATVSLARLRATSFFYGKIGNKIFFERARAMMKKEGIGVRYLARGREQDKGFSLIMMGPTHDRTIFTYRESNDFDITHAKKFLKTVDALYVGDIDASIDVMIDAVVAEHKKSKLRVFLNPSRFQLERKYRPRLMSLLRSTEIVALNDSEAQQVVGARSMSTVSSMMRALHALGPAIAIVTYGPKGAYVSDGNTISHIGIWDVPVLDRTGSGDAFFSTFVAMVLQGKPITDAAQLATINASNVVTQYGAQRGLLTLNKLLVLKRKLKIPIKQVG